MTIREAQAWLTEKLSKAVGPDEAKAMAKAIIQDVKGYKPIDVVLHGDRELLPQTVDRMGRIAQRVIDGEPLQYALGKAYFHGRTFKVDSSTLIPRPETSQLVDLICDQLSAAKSLRVLDIGTGSGCIAISLALDLPFAQVDAIDIAPPALKIAEQNAADLHAKVNFMLDDALNLDKSTISSNKYDIIVSNPPYVMQSEAQSMDERVYKYEPTSALFVPDQNPLLFYKAIASWAASHLLPAGKLYFEINPLCADQLKKMMVSLGYTDTEIIRDYKGNNRFAICAK